MIWRSVRRMGAVSIGPSVSALPGALGDRRHLEALAARVRETGGAFDVLEVEAFAADTDARLRERLSAARAAEYAEIVERSDAIVDELEREGPTFAEVQENEVGVSKLRPWLRRAVARDRFSCPVRGKAEALARVEEGLASFIEAAVAAEGR
jgi:Protein ChrB, N-terminal